MNWKTTNERCSVSGMARALRFVRRWTPYVLPPTGQLRSILSPKSDDVSMANHKIQQMSRSNHILIVIPLAAHLVLFLALRSFTVCAAAYPVELFAAWSFALWKKEVPSTNDWLCAGAMGLAIVCLALLPLAVSTNGVHR